MYLKRIIEQRIQNSLNRIGCVMVVGPKGIGKTETSKKLCKSFIELDNPSKNYKQLLEVDYEFILNGEKPRLIDEWQEVPKVFNLIRREIDNQNLKGAYILCGSTSAEIDKELHSGMNRVSRIKMRPLSYTELKLSEQKIDFNSFFDKDFILSPIETNFPLKKHIESICIGGFPLNIENNLSDSWENNRDYWENFINFDISKTDKINILLFKNFLKSIARNISHDLKYSTIAKDANIDERTVVEYFNILEKNYLLDNLSVWNTKLRSRANLRKKPKVNFIDPCLGVNLINATYEKLSKDFETLGFYFESLVIRDLKTYAETLGYDIFFYSDDENLEIDCIIENKDGYWSLFEIKLGSENGIGEGVKNINKLVKKLDDSVLKMLISKNIITAKNISYKVGDINIIGFSHIYLNF